MMSRFLLVACCLVGAITAVGLAAAPDAVTLRVLTFNLCHGGEEQGQPLARSVEVIRAARADVAGLQETFGLPRNGVKANRGAEIAGLLGWHYLDQPNRNGIVSRHPIVDQTPSKQGACIALPDGREVWIFNVHFAPNPYQPYQIYGLKRSKTDRVASAEEAVAAARRARGEQVTTLLAEIDTLRGQEIPVFVTGDFNEPSALDWTPGAAAQGRCLFPVAWPASEALRAAGFADAYRLVHPDPVAKPGFTWTPIFADDDPRERHDRIDMVYSRGADVIQAEIVGEKSGKADIVVAPYPSDHRAVVAEARVKSAQKTAK